MGGKVGRECKGVRGNFEINLRGVRVKIFIYNN